MKLCILLNYIHYLFSTLFQQTHSQEIEKYILYHIIHRKTLQINVLSFVLSYNLSEKRQTLNIFPNFLILVVHEVEAKFHDILAIQKMDKTY